MIRTLRPVFSGVTASCLLLLLALYGIGREVWVARVFENMPQTGDLFAVTEFYAAAFVHTQLVVQLLSLVCFAIAIYLARETARLIARALTTPVSS